MEHLHGEQTYKKEEELRDRIVEIPPRGNWKILGFIEPAESGEKNVC